MPVTPRFLDPLRTEKIGPRRWRLTHELRYDSAVLGARLVIPVGTMAIAEVMGHTGPLVEVVGRKIEVEYHGVEMDAIALPHPSGASTWHRMEPGKTLLHKALGLLAKHPEIRREFGNPDFSA